MYQVLSIRLFCKANRPHRFPSIFFLYFFTALSIFSFLPVLTSALFNPLPAFSHSSYTRRKSTCSPTLSHLRTQISPIWPLISKIFIQSFSRPLVYFGHEHIQKAEAQTLPIPSTQISNFALFDYETQSKHNPFLSLTARPAARSRAPTATSTLSSFAFGSFVSRLDPSSLAHLPQSLATFSFTTFSSFFSFPFLLANSSIFLPSYFLSLFSLFFKGLGLNIPRAVKFASLSTD